ncbi:hypothetical protein QJQ45_024293 [Haematococcus lacustris]|nr:hypothetical protein QJQ45_024293 [Haematococcus lacustris]
MTHKVLPAEQFGFIPGRSTMQPMFILRHLVHAQKASADAKHRKLYTAFIDFKQAYDHIPRQQLWEHLRVGVKLPQPLLACLEGLYRDDSYVLIDGPHRTPPVIPDQGVKQGCPISPLLFALYVHDISKEFLGPVDAVRVQGTPVTHFMYADDLTLVSTSPHGLQRLVCQLQGFADRKHLTVNVGKSKHEILPVVREFKYFGMHFNPSATPAFAATHMRAGMFLAMRKACKRAREYGVLHDPYALCHLIRAFVLPLGLYGSQVWGTAFLGHGMQLSNPVQTRMLSFLRVIKADVELGRGCQASWSAQFQLAARELMGGEFTLSPDMVLGTKAMEVKWLESQSGTAAEHVLRHVLTAWCMTHKVLPAEQFGFIPGRSTMQPMFILRHLVHAQKASADAKHRKLYTAFIDFKQAYDHIPRQQLWEHLRVGVKLPQPLLACLEGLYRDDSYVLIDGPHRTPPVIPDQGVKQGCPISPLLFALYVHDISKEFLGPVDAVRVQGTPVTHFMYADDLTLVSTSPHGLQRLVCQLQGFADRKHLTVNVGKSKHEILPVVREFKYFGMHFNPSATPAFAATHMRAGMFLAMRKACKRAREYGVLHDPYALCHLIRAFVLPLGLYGSQVWGTAFLGHGMQLSNPVQTRMLSFLRFAARVRGSMSGLMVLH